MLWVFWVAVGVIAYVYAGYPCWLWLRARLRPWPVRRSRFEPQISFVMVVRNEAAVLKEKLDNLLGLDYPADRFQIVVVSDGSTDDTEKIMSSYSGERRVQCVIEKIPAGKACGLNAGVPWAEGEIVVFTDARQQIETDALLMLLENFADGSVGCVSGELMLGNRAVGERAQGMGLYWRFEKKIRELESASGSVMGATGAFYAARRELLAPLPPDLILDDVYIPLRILRQGRRVIFDSRARAWDTPHLGAGREFARKVRTLTGNYQLVQLEPWLLTGANPARFQFVSHKLMRLLSPFALAAMLFASFFLLQPIYRVALIAQLFLYGLSVVPIRFRALGPLARLSDAASTFLILNVAALVAFANFVTGRKAVWTR